MEVFPPPYLAYRKQHFPEFFRDTGACINNVFLNVLSSEPSGWCIWGVGVQILCDKVTLLLLSPCLKCLPLYPAGEVLAFQPY